MAWSVCLAGKLITRCYENLNRHLQGIFQAVFRQVKWQLLRIVGAKCEGCIQRGPQVVVLDVSQNTSERIVGLMSVFLSERLVEEHLDGHPIKFNELLKHPEQE